MNKNKYQDVSFYPNEAGLRLKGQLLTYIESLGFEQKREKAVKDMVSNLLEDFFSKCGFLEDEKDIEYIWNAYHDALDKLKIDYENQDK